MSLPTKEVILLIFCMDYRSRVPEELKDFNVFELRLPGGPLSSAVLPATVEAKYQYINFALEKVNPVKIVLMGHSHCAAATTIDLDDKGTQEATLRFAEEVRIQHPDILIEVMFDPHSECGYHREKPFYLYPQGYRETEAVAEVV